MKNSLSFKLNCPCSESFPLHINYFEFSFYKKIFNSKIHSHVNNNFNFVCFHRLLYFTTFGWAVFTHTPISYFCLSWLFLYLNFISYFGTIILCSKFVSPFYEELKEINEKKFDFWSKNKNSRKLMWKKTKQI